MEKVSTFKKTSDDWYPCYFIANDKRHEQGMVEVKFHGNINPPSYNYKTYRVSVWGADDCGMDFDTSDELLAEVMYIELLRMPYITKEKLTEFGFNFF